MLPPLIGFYELSSLLSLAQREQVTFFSVTSLPESYLLLMVVFIKLSSNHYTVNFSIEGLKIIYF